MYLGTQIATGFDYAEDECKSSHGQRTLLVEDGGCLQHSSGYTHSCQGPLKDHTFHCDNWNLNP